MYPFRYMRKVIVMALTATVMMLAASCGNKSANAQSEETVVPEGYQTYDTPNFNISVPKDFKKTALCNDKDLLQFDADTLLMHSDGEKYSSSIRVDAAFNTGWSTDLMGNAFNMKDYANNLKGMREQDNETCEEPVIDGNTMILRTYYNTGDTENEYRFNNIWFAVVDGDKAVSGTISYVQEEADTYDSVVVPIVKSIKIK